jgi:type VI secretion system secreted protein VgrG
MASLRQSDRLMQFTSPSVGKDVLVIESFTGSESISSLFEFRAFLLAPVGTAIDPKALVGSKATVAVGLNDVQGSRYFNGIVSRFEEGNSDDEFAGYAAYIVPSMWLLTLSTNCRVFQKLTVMDIVKKVIGEYGLSLSDKTTAPYQPLDYCTQYNETDFHFVSRLLEQNGIFYWFEHTAQDNKVAFGDSRTAYSDCPLSASVVFKPVTSQAAEGSLGAQMSSFGSVATMVPGKHSTQDYEYRDYTVHDQPSKASASPYGKNGFEDFFYPAGEEGYVKVTDKKLNDPNFGKIHLESRSLAADATARMFQGKSNLRSMSCGYTFSLTRHTNKEWNRKYFLTEVSHDIHQVPAYRPEPDPGFEGGYQNRLVAISSDIVYKPVANTPKPRIYGPQTAMVVAPIGEEMSIDKLGRVCVQFFWDRERPPGTVDNTWVRVAQTWAGSGWGTYFWPRLNDEVVVQFLDGDPDNPVVTGSVYNGVNVPKYKLPDMSTRSGLVTRSSKGGSEQNANELRFEDKTGSEQVFLNAERDMDHRTENDNRRFVGGKDSLIVKGAQYEEVDTDRHANIKGNTVDKVGGNSDINITSNLNEQVGSNYSLQVGQNHGEKVGQNYALDAGMEVYIKAGMTLVIESGMELCLKGAGGFITIGPAGIAISGTMVMINSGGAAVSGSPASLQSPGDPTAPDEADDGSKGGKKN